MIFNNIKMALRHIKNSLYYYFAANNDGEETTSQSSQTSQVSEKSTCDKSTQTDEVSIPPPTSFPTSVPIAQESSTYKLKTTGVQTLIHPPNTPEKTMEELTEDVLGPLVNNIIADVMKKMEEGDFSDEEDEDAQYIQSKPAPASEKNVKRPRLSPTSPPFIPTAARIERIKMESCKTTSPTFQETLKKNRCVVHNPRIPTPPPLPPIELKTLSSNAPSPPSAAPSPPPTFQPKTPLHTYDIPNYPVPSLNLNSFKSEISPTSTEKISHTVPAPQNIQTLFSVSGSSTVRGLKINEKKLSKYLKATPTVQTDDNAVQKNKPKKLKIRLPPLKEELKRDVPPPAPHSKNSKNSKNPFENVNTNNNYNLRSRNKSNRYNNL